MIVHHVEPVVNNVEFFILATWAPALLALFCGVGDTSKVQIEAPYGRKVATTLTAALEFGACYLVLLLEMVFKVLLPLGRVTTKGTDVVGVNIEEVVDYVL